MLDAFGELMPDRYKKRRVSAIRDFPKGCGRHALLLDVKSPQEDPAQPLSHPPIAPSPLAKPESSPLAKPESESLDVEPLQKAPALPHPLPLPTPRVEPELGGPSGAEILDVKPLQQAPALRHPPPTPTLLAEPESGKTSGGEIPVANGVSKSILLLENVPKAQPMEVDRFSEPLGPEKVVSPSEEVKGSDSGVKLENSHLLKESFGKVELLEFPEAGGNEACGSKLYGPAKRRKAPVIRHFPVGCGRNAVPMSRGECLRMVAGSNGKSLVAYKESDGEKKPATEDSKGKLERNDVEGIQGRVKQIKGRVLAESISPNQLNGSMTDEDREKKILAGAALSSSQEGVRENCGYIVRNFASQSNLNDMFAEENIEKNVFAAVAPETSCQGVRGIEVEENKSISMYGLKGIAKDEHIKKTLTRKMSSSKLEGSDTKQADRNFLSREAQEPKLSHFNEKSQSRVDAKHQSQSKSKAVGKDGRGSANFSELKRGRDIKSLKWKLLEADEEDGAVDLQPQVQKDVGLEVCADRLIVQALMASPNCPWSQGRRSGMTAYHASVSGEKAKRGRMPAKKRASSGTSVSHFQSREVVEDDEDSVADDVEDERALVLYQGSQELCVNVIPGLSSSRQRGDGGEEAVTRTEVRKTLRLFQVICRKLLQGEESRSKGAGRAYRVDLRAANILKEKGACINTGKPILGPVPGVQVGDEFHFRVELSVVGLHRPYQAGIDYMNRGGILVAVSIVAFEGHADEMDGSEVLIYSGSGGSAAQGDKPAEDQKLERGNLSLKNSIEIGTPVRVIRGFKELKWNDPQDARPKPFSTLTYDGLYLVERYWQEEGSQGFNIYKFQLRRIPGQPEIALKQVKSLKKSRVREGLCVIDISEGKEKMPISAINTIDNDSPPCFKYITKMIYPSWYEKTTPRGCDCIDGCSDSEWCACAVKNGGEIPFNFNGAIVHAKPLVYECGPSCKCPPSCHNRVSQHGIKVQLEIFKTGSMGWGVRSLTSIPSGSFICEYTGELLRDKDAEQRNNDEYLFDIGHNYDDLSLWEGLPTLIPDLQSNGPCEVVEDGGFTIDAAEYGNVGRFINNSCSPNLFAQSVLYDHGDKRIPHIMLFAAENIPPLQELTYHYNYMIGEVRDSEGNIKRKDCYCGSHDCTGRLY